MGRLIDTMAPEGDGFLHSDSCATVPRDGSVGQGNAPTEQIPRE